MIGRPPKDDREEIGKMICPICGETVSVYRGYHGTGYSNHGGHGFKLTRKQILEFFFEKEKQEENTRLVLQKTEEEKKKIEEEPKPKNGSYSIFGIEF